jgi:hypothetical protein
MSEEYLIPFYLVGGPALALQIGHRLSIDLDFFGDAELEEMELMPILKRSGTVHILKKSSNILICAVNNIKVDFVHYRYPWIEKPVTNGLIKLASLPDIAAMKLNAISGRGSKKDFVDLFFLLRIYSLEQLITFYNRKYPDGSEFLVLKSLSYFEDADQQEMPVMLIPAEWEDIKTQIKKKTLNYLSET